MLEKIDRWWPLICLAVLTTCFGIGCGQQSVEHELPALVPVKGQLVLDGQPEPGVMVTLMPQGSTTGQTAFGITNESGAFEIEYAMGGAGCPQGSYVIICSKLVTPDGKPIPEGKTAADVMAKEKIPVKYRSLDKPFQTVTVGATGVGELRIEIKSKG